MKATEILKHEHQAILLVIAAVEKEDNVLYPMADRLLKSVDQETLAQAFDKVESEEMGEGVHAKYHAWIEKLVIE